jgi:hypothetical protein
MNFQSVQADFDPVDRVLTAQSRLNSSRIERSAESIPIDNFYKLYIKKNIRHKS